MSERMSEMIGKNIVLETKNSGKYFGVLDAIEDMGGGLVFIILLDKNGKLQCFTSGEVARMEEIR